MASPERPPVGMPLPAVDTDFHKQIEELQRQLEIVDENENQIEREAQREALLAQLDSLQDQDAI